MNTRIVIEEVSTLSPKQGPVTFIPADKNRFSQKRVMKSLFRILKGNVLCSISTVARGNRAHINTAYFCFSQDLELYFLSDPSSLHSRNLSTNSSMAIAVFNSAQKWGSPDRGIQLFGTCGEIKGSQKTKAERLYGKRFPAFNEWMAGPSQAFRYRFYRFVARKVKILDEPEFGAGVFVISAVKRD